MGGSTTASGDFSTAIGRSTTAPSYGETTIGLYNTAYTPNSTTVFDAADRLFTIGNGPGAGAESNALTILKDGTMNINDAYNMPTADGTNGQVLTTDGAGNATWTTAAGGEFQSIGGLVQNTTATATDDFVFGSTSLDNIAGGGDDYRMFFDKSKGAFRAGFANGAQWDDVNVGGGSTAMGGNTTASGILATAMGHITTASGNFSTAMGTATTASSYAETTIGLYNTAYTPNSTTAFDAADRLFTIGNGTGPGVRSNAMTILKDGTMNINDAYNMPTADGTNGQVLTTDGAGNVTFATPTAAASLWTDLGTQVRPTNNENVRSGGDFITAGGNGVINCGGSLNATANVIGDVATPTISIATGDEDLWIEDDLEVTSQAYKPGGGTWATISDQRLKREIKPFSDGLSMLMQIEPVTFKYNTKLNLKDPEKEYVGVLAQDVEKVAPYMVEKKNFFEVKEENENGEEVVIQKGEAFLTYDANAMTYILINAVKEQQKTIEAQAAEIEALKAANKTLSADNATIKTQLNSLQAEVSAIKALLNKTTSK